VLLPLVLVRFGRWVIGAIRQAGVIIHFSIGRQVVAARTFRQAASQVVRPMLARQDLLRLACFGVDVALAGLALIHVDSCSDGGMLCRVA
jgi:hypothetical protein